MTGREVVLTGAGLMTPLGIGLEENWSNLKAKRSGIRCHPRNDLPACFQYFGRVGRLQTSELAPSHLAAQMKFLNRGALLGLSAAHEAVQSAGVEFSAITPERRATYIASGDLSEIGYEFLSAATKEATGGLWEEMNFEKLNQAAQTNVNPFFLLESISNNLFSFLSAFYEFRGPNTNLASLSPHGSQALELARRSIEHGRADVALAVGYGNWITEIPLFELQGLGLLSKCDSGASSFQPFDRSRDGFIPAEGGAALFLEAADLARRRGAKVLGTIKGCGNAIEISSRNGLNVPEKVSLRSMRQALDDAGCDVGDLAFIAAHGSATQKGDRSELRSISDLLMKEGGNVPLCGMKPYTGHMGAASDLGEIILSMKAMEEALVPATLNFTVADREFSELRICDHHQRSNKNLFLSVSYGLGGQSSSVVIAVG